MNRIERKKSRPPKSKDIRWHDSKVTREDRIKVHGHKGVTLWLTGLSGSGKSTLATMLERRLSERGCVAYVLDGDNLRHGLNQDLGFSPEDRRENIRRTGEVASLFADAGDVVICALISPYREDRDRARKAHASGSFIEIFVNASLEECERRDPKGLYKKARAGEIPEFTGISAPYEQPQTAEIVVDTEKEDVEESIVKVLTYLERNEYIFK